MPAHKILAALTARGASGTKTTENELDELVKALEGEITPIGLAATSPKSKDDFGEEERNDLDE